MKMLSNEVDRRTGPFFLHFSRFSPRSDTKDVWYILPWWRFKFFSREEWWMSLLKWKGFFFWGGGYDFISFITFKLFEIPPRVKQGEKEFVINHNLKNDISEFSQLWYQSVNHLSCDDSRTFSVPVNLDNRCADFFFRSFFLFRLPSFPSSWWKSRKNWRKLV